MKLLVVGCGSIGRRHLGNFAAVDPGLALGAVDLDAARLAAACRETSADSFSSLEAGLAWQPDGVVVAVSTAAHLPIARAAVDAGCGVLVEKPLAASPDGLSALVEAAAARKVCGLVGYNWRFHPAYRRMRRWIEEGRLGRLAMAAAVYGQYLPDWHPEEDYRTGYSARKDLGGGILRDCHEFDYLTWLVGDAVETVYCDAGQSGLLAVETEDRATAILQFASGTVGTVQVDYLSRARRRRFEFTGERGNLVWDLDSGLTWYDAARREWIPVEGTEVQDVNDTYRAEAAHFLRCLRGEEAPSVDLARGRWLVELVAAAERSSREGRRVPAPLPVAAL